MTVVPRAGTRVVPSYLLDDPNLLFGLLFPFLIRKMREKMSNPQKEELDYLTWPILESSMREPLVGN